MLLFLSAGRISCEVCRLAAPARLLPSTGPSPVLLLILPAQSSLPSPLFPPAQSSPPLSPISLPPSPLPPHPGLFISSQYSAFSRPPPQSLTPPVLPQAFPRSPPHSPPPPPPRLGGEAGRCHHLPVLAAEPLASLLTGCASAQ